MTSKQIVVLLIFNSFDNKLFEKLKVKNFELLSKTVFIFITLDVEV